MDSNYWVVYYRVERYRCVQARSEAVIGSHCLNRAVMYNPGIRVQKSGRLLLGCTLFGRTLTVLEIRTIGKICVFVGNAYAMSDARPVNGQLKKFVFRGKSSTNGDTRGDYLEVVIPELLSAGYSFYTWPSAPLLAWYLWTQRRHLRGLRVLELGCGTGLPGILAAKCGAQVTLTDSVSLPRSLRHLSACCEANGLVSGRDVQLLGLTWGLFLADIHSLRPVDLLLASDCFYEPTQFEEVLSTVAYFLDGTDARFLCAYQERSADWSIEGLLKKWGLKGALLDLDSLSESSGVDYRTLIGDKSLHLLEVVSV